MLHPGGRTMTAVFSDLTAPAVAEAEHWTAHNYHPLPVVIADAEGAWVTDVDAYRDYGPYTPGFKIVPYGDLAALSDAVDDTTVAVLIEPIQGEAGVLVPPPDYLPGIRALCTAKNVLMIADEVQSGLGRTG